MKFFITCYAAWDAKVDKVIAVFTDEVKDSFYLLNYGSSIEAISIIIVCRNSENNFKQRKRYSKRDRELYTDIMLDYEQFRVMDQDTRERTVAKKIMTELPELIEKYKFEDFDLQRFEADMRRWFVKLNWM